MNLREKVAEAIHDAVGGGGVPYARIAPNDSRLEQADAAIATIFDALLSDMAVEALADIHMPAGEFRAMGEHHLRGIYDMNTPDTYCKVDLRSHYRAALKVAMTALTADDAQTGGEG